MTDDPFALIDYRSLVDWPKRLAREWPFFEAVFATAPVRRVLDLGCGPGEHARLFASHGFEVAGIDRSPAQLVQARREGESDRLRFVEGDIADVVSLVEGGFGAAVSIGNTLPSLGDEVALGRLFAGLRQRLLPHAPVVLQLLNYDRIARTQQRALPVNVLPDPDGDGELVFLRLMDPQPDGRVIFTPSVLRYRSGGDPPLQVVATRHADMRGWRLAELEPLLKAAGFADVQAYGGMDRALFDAGTSTDLVVVAR
jgi:SAM-dependent methyltransferase